MSDELTRAEQWLYEKLTADTALAAILGTNWFSEAAPEGTPTPFGIFSVQLAQDVTTAFHNRIMVNGTWTVRAVTDAESFNDQLQTCADRIDALLDRSSGGTADSAVIFTSVREEPFKQLDVVDGKQYRSLGGTYRLFIQRP